MRDSAHGPEAPPLPPQDAATFVPEPPFTSVASMKIIPISETALTPKFHIPSKTAKSAACIVEFRRIALEMGHDEAWIVALAAELQTGNDPAGTAPRLGDLGEFTNEPLFDATLGVVVRHQALPALDLTMQTRIAVQANDIDDAPVLAPADQPLAAKS